MIDAGTPLPETSAIATPSLSFVDCEVIEIIAADVARGNVDPADLKSRDNRRFTWQEDALDVARDFAGRGRAASSHSLPNK